MVTLHRIESGEPCHFTITGPDCTIVVKGNENIVAEIFLAFNLGKAEIVQQWIRDAILEMNEAQLREQFTKNGWTLSIPENPAGQ